MLCQPGSYLRPGCYMGDPLPQMPDQFQLPAPPILSTSPKVGAELRTGRGRMARQRAGHKETGRHYLDWKDSWRQPVPPGYVTPQHSLGGNACMPVMPGDRGHMQENCAPSAALGLLEAFPAGEGPEAGAEAGDPRLGRVDACGPCGLPAPLLVRNTFLDAKPQRSPSLDPFFEERKVKSSPPSRPHSGKLEVAVPRAVPGSPMPQGRICSLFDALVSPMEGGPLPGQPEALMGVEAPLVPDLAGLPGLQFLEDLDGTATPELSYREPWRPTPLAGACSSSGGSAECASAACSTATPGERPEVIRPALGSPELPSRGSALHQWGACKPCAFVFQEGCQNDLECQFCHLCEPGERKRRKKERLAMRREVREEARRRRQEASAGGGWRNRGATEC